MSSTSFCPPWGVWFGLVWVCFGRALVCSTAKWSIGPFCVFAILVRVGGWCGLGLHWVGFGLQYSNIVHCTILCVCHWGAWGSLVWFGFALGWLWSAAQQNGQLDHFVCLPLGCVCGGVDWLGLVWVCSGLALACSTATGPLDHFVCLPLGCVGGFGVVWVCFGLAFVVCSAAKWSPGVFCVFAIGV